MKTRVREYRVAAKMTQQQLAERVHVSPRTIISIEKGQYSPSLMLAYRMAEVFGTTVEDLCCLKENREMEDLQNEKLSPASLPGANQMENPGAMGRIISDACLYDRDWRNGGR